MRHAKWQVCEFTGQLVRNRDEEAKTKKLRRAEFINRTAARAAARIVNLDNSRAQVKALSTVLGLPMATIRQRLYFGFFADLENSWLDSLTKGVPE